MTTQYDVDYFIRKFEAISDDLWLIDDLYAIGGEDLTGPRCAVGHCSRVIGGRVETSTEESKALAGLFGCSVLGVAHINDGRNPRYNQLHPKQRILAALHDIKRQQEQNNLRQCGVEKNYPNQETGLGSNEKEQQERDGYKQSGEVSASLDCPNVCRVFENSARGGYVAAQVANRGDGHERALSPKTGYVPAEEYRQVPSPNSPSPMAELGKKLPCAHLFISPGDSCVLCGFVKPATAPVKEGV